MSIYDGSIDMEMADFLRYSGIGHIQTEMSKLQLNLSEVEKLIRASAAEVDQLFKSNTKKLVNLLQIQKPDNVSDSLFYKKMAGVSLDVVSRYVDRYNSEKSLFENLPGYEPGATYCGTDEVYGRYKKTAECLKNYQKDMDKHLIAKACVLLGKPVYFDFEHAKDPPVFMTKGQNYSVSARMITRENGEFAPGWYNGRLSGRVEGYHKTDSGLFMVEFADKVYVSDDLSVHYYKYYKEHEEAMREAERMKNPEFAENKAKIMTAMQDITKTINELDQQSQGKWISQFGPVPHAPAYGGPDISDVSTFVGYTPEIFGDASAHARRVYNSEAAQYTYDISKYVTSIVEVCAKSGIPIIQTCDSILSNSNVSIEARNPGVPLEFIDFVIDQLPSPGSTFELPAGSKFIGEHAGCEEFTYGMEYKVLEVSGSGREFAILTDKGLITSCDMDTIYKNLTLAREQEEKGLESQVQDIDRN